MTTQAAPRADNPWKLGIGKRLRLMRGVEGLTRKQLTEMTGVPVSTFRKVEAGWHSPDFHFPRRITAIPQLSRYALWLTTGETAPEYGQVAPEVPATAGTGERLRMMRIAEGLSRREMAEITGFLTWVIVGYETTHREAGADILLKILSMGRFRQYADWFTGH